MSSPALLIISLLLALSVMTAVWWRQLYTNNAGVVDAWWSYNFGLIAGVYAWLGSGSISHRALLLVVIVWSFRLGSYLLWRNTRQGHEDVRYTNLRKKYGERVRLRMWIFFCVQGVSNVVLSVPFLLICSMPGPELELPSWLGAVLVLIGVLGEGVADQQLKSFKKSAAAGQVCRQGLWAWSRHPNYFFEWVVWCGFALMATPAEFGWLAWIAPVIIYWLLTRVTGIPLLERLAVDSKGAAYRQYQQEVSAFFPWPPISRSNR